MSSRPVFLYKPFKKSEEIQGGSWINILGHGFRESSRSSMKLSWIESDKRWNRIGFEGELMVSGKEEVEGSEEKRVEGK
ncbi:uncharacterized protein G2W53_038724 [Senna tora]|uniref:Uncharacterized protein n=1 Tax=Senna tora TaxID=362788 RepID=A0A834SPI1_9FABA|nr:uncharacterized protein G2W53_038724 [Senna tora]